MFHIGDVLIDAGYLVDVIAIYIFFQAVHQQIDSFASRKGDRTVAFEGFFNGGALFRICASKRSGIFIGIFQRPGIFFYHRLNGDSFQQNIEQSVSGLAVRIDSNGDYHG